MRQIIKPKTLKLAVMASGRGSNFDAICEAIERNDLDAEIMILVSDKKDAPALNKARARAIEAIHISPKNFSSVEEYEKQLVATISAFNVDMVVLAGYMRLVGSTFLQAFKHRVVNIHPSLLPAFKGLHAQKQALDYGVKFTGCTVHIVDEGMDTGPIIDQVVVPVYDEDTEDTLTKRILQEEHQIYWRVLRSFAEGRVYIDGRKIIII